MKKTKKLYEIKVEDIGIGHRIPYQENKNNKRKVLVVFNLTKKESTYYFYNAYGKLLTFLENSTVYIEM